MKIGDRVYFHGFIDEIRKDTVIIRNEGGYFGTIKSEIVEAQKTEDIVSVIRCKDCKHRFEGEKFHNCCEVLMEMSHWLVEIPVKDDWHCGSGERKEE